MNSLNRISLLLLLPLFIYADTRGIKIKALNNEMIDMPYSKSHALLVGISQYTNGWPSLESIPGELDRVEEALVKQGFIVKKVINAKGNELFKSYEEFVSEYGYDVNNRLLFYFSGHGYTTNNGKKGFLYHQMLLIQMST